MTEPTYEVRTSACNHPGLFPENDPQVTHKICPKCGQKNQRISEREWLVSPPDDTTCRMWDLRGPGQVRDPDRDCSLTWGHEGPHSFEATKQREGDQRLPQGGQQCVQDLVIAEMEESKRVGLERYGSVLMTFNGRRSIQDVAEEVRDLHVYLTQVRAESEADRETLIEVVSGAYRRDFPMVDQVSAKKAATTAVDAVMGWVVGQRMGGER